MHHAPRSVRFRILAGVAAAGLALGGLAACSDGDDDAADAPEATFEDLLDLVPDTKENRKLVIIQRLDVAAAGMTPEAVEGSARDRELTRLAQLSIQTGTGEAAVLGGRRATKVYGALGFVPSDVRAVVAAGQPPTGLEVALVDADQDAVLAAATKAVDGAERRKIEGVDAATWLDDAEIELDLDTPVGDLPGQAARLAWVAPGALAWSTTDPVLAAAVAAAEDGESSLADDDSFDDLAEVLDDADAHAALLVGEPIERFADMNMPADVAEAADDPALEPYAALAVGSIWGEDGLELVIAIAHDDDATAEANEKALTAGVAEGRSARTAQPWTELLTDGEITRDGTVVIGRFSVESPGLWQAMVVTGEPLLAAG